MAVWKLDDQWNSIEHPGYGFRRYYSADFDGVARIDRVEGDAGNPAASVLRVSYYAIRDIKTLKYSTPELAAARGEQLRVQADMDEACGELEM